MKRNRKSSYLKQLYILVLVFSAALVFAAINPVIADSPQAPLTPNAPSATACADFNQVAIGSSVEGLGTIHPNLNISTSGNAVAVAEDQEPRAYGAPNGDDSIPNGGVDILGSGFSDIEQFHDYTFTFSPDVTIDYLSVQMLDYGDFNPPQATEHSVSLVAYDANDALVDSHTLSFTSDGQSLPRAGSAGDLWMTGDAISAVPGEPGNFTFTVTGNNIVRVALEFSSDLGPGSTDPNLGLAVLCFSTEEELPEPPAGTVCADFGQIAIGSTVEGLGTIHPDLNISTTGNAVVVAEAQEPKAYGAPNGDNNILNGGVDVLLNGFFDEEKLHEYDFSFGPDVTVDYFSVQMLDYGDFNPPQATEHSVTLAAYDANNSLVDINTLSFTSDGQSLPRDGSAGDLWFTGDAITANPGQPGNYTFFVSGSEISRLELQFSSDLGPGATDPNFALSILCFEPEETPEPPAGTVCADFSQIAIGSTVEGLGTIHPDLNISTTGNAVVVAEAQEPKAYGAPNGDNSILNGGVDVLLNGFFDEEKLHEYDFSFGPDVTVDYFSVQMLDYGDFNPPQATEHSVSLAAYDANDILVDINTLSFISDGQSLPRDGSAGDLWFTGDAITANPGQPGNYNFVVSGSEISRLELQFSSDLGPGATDPNFALSILCFEPETPPPPPNICVNGAGTLGQTGVVGVGLGDRNFTINPQTLALDNAANVTDLRAQVAGRVSGFKLSVNSTTFTTPLETVTLTTPSAISRYAYTYETELAPAASVESFIDGIKVGSYHTPRSLVLYPTYATDTEYVNVTQTTNGYVYQGRDLFSHTETLTFPAATDAATLQVTAVVIDNSDDDRPLIVTAAAGGVSQSQTILGPDHGPELNIVAFTLADVPAGTTELTVTLESPDEIGDSGILTGVNMSYACVPNTDQ